MYKYCDCSSCKDYRNNPYNFMEIYGAKYNGKKVNTLTFKSIDDYYEGMADCFSWPEFYTKKNYTTKGKDNMTTINVNYNAYSTSVFNIDEPKFKVGDKIKFYIKDYDWKQGIVYTVSKQINISSTQNDKNFKIDNVQWHYVIIESGTLKTHNGVREDHVKIDDTPDYNKYFKMLGAYGLTFKESDFTIVYWEQAPIFNYWGILTGYNTDVTLKTKFNDHKTSLSFWTNDLSKLPTIIEKC